MSILRGIRKAASGPGAALGGVLTSSAVYGPDGFLDVENISLSRDRAMKLSTVNRCVEVRSCTIAALPVYLMRESTKERLRDHRLAGVLWGRPNEAMTRFDYERLMQVNLDLRGNAYAWINRDNRTGYPVELIPLQPDHVTPYVALDSSLWYIYTNPRTGQMFRLSPADVLHYKAYSLDGIEGISILHRAALTIQTGLAAQEYQMAMYRNGGRPSGVLTTDTDIGGEVTVTRSDGSTEKIGKKELIRREWEKIHNGPGNGFRVAVMDNGLKYQALSVSNSWRARTSGWPMCAGSSVRPCTWCMPASRPIPPTNRMPLSSPASPSSPWSSSGSRRTATSCCFPGSGPTGCASGGS